MNGDASDPRQVHHREIGYAFLLDDEGERGIGDTLPVPGDLISCGINGVGDG